MTVQIIEICKTVEIHIQSSDDYAACIGTGYFTDRFNAINDKIATDLESLINQEVEKRIAERMPSEMTFEKAEIAAKETDYACFAVELRGNEINFADAAAFYLEGWNACRSRLTCSEKPNNSQKTEGGKG